ncbi:hypothetical protein C8Q74DRAFT_1173517, partial [Fomes fomentarius]
LVPGHEMTVHWYFRRIRGLISKLSQASAGVLPTNRKSVGDFLGSWPLHFVENLLSGLDNLEDWDNFAWSHSHVFSKFHVYVQDYGKNMDITLQDFEYHIEDEGTLKYVVGIDRPERV